MVEGAGTIMRRNHHLAGASNHHPYKLSWHRGTGGRVMELVISWIRECVNNFVNLKPLTNTVYRGNRDIFTTIFLIIKAAVNPAENVMSQDRFILRPSKYLCASFFTFFAVLYMYIKRNNIYKILISFWSYKFYCNSGNPIDDKSIYQVLINCFN